MSGGAGVAIPHLSRSGSPPPTGSSTSWKASDYAEYRSRQTPESTRPAEPTPHSPELRIAPVLFAAKRDRSSQAGGFRGDGGAATV